MCLLLHISLHSVRHVEESGESDRAIVTFSDPQLGDPRAVSADALDHDLLPADALHKRMCHMRVDVTRRGQAIA